MIMVARRPVYGVVFGTPPFDAIFATRHGRKQREHSDSAKGLQFLKLVHGFIHNLFSNW
jgi:hypothetical protein